MAKIDHCVESEGIVYKIVEEKDYSRMVDFYFSMLQDEACNRATGCTYEKGNYPEGMHEQVMGFLIQGVSLMAVEAKTDRVVGLRFAYLTNRGDKPQEAKTFEEYCKTYPPTHSHLTVIDDLLYNPMDFFDTYPQLERLYCMYMLGVHQDFRGRGIAKRLVQEAFKVGIKAGCQATCVYATSPISKAIFDKLGMKVINVLKTEEYVDPTSGSPVFPEVKEFTAHFRILDQCT